MSKKIIFFTLIIFVSMKIYSQGSPDYGGGLKVKIDEEGKKYFRIISWAQVQANYITSEIDDTTSPLSFQLRRARVLLYSQISPKFMIVTHFGLNSLNAASLHPTGKGDGAQLFMHDAWVQYNLSEKLTLGGGLHYFNGVSRLNNQSTLNIMTMDNNRQSWATLGLSDQFGRHVGFFAKGDLGKLQYQLAVNDALTTGLDTRDANVNSAVYGGKRLLGSKEAGKNFAGYFSYNLKDKESYLLPYKVGTYLGTKKVLNIGAGFFYHPNGSVIQNTDTSLSGENVSILAADVFYDAPLGENGSAVTAYAVIQNNNYGKNYKYSAYGTGTMLYTHIGYVIPGEKDKTRFQPFVSYQNHSYDAVTDNSNKLGLGINAYFSGHNSKLTLEFDNEKLGNTSTNSLNLQAMIYL